MAQQGKSENERSAIGYVRVSPPISSKVKDLDLVFASLDLYGHELHLFTGDPRFLYFDLDPVSFPGGDVDVASCVLERQPAASFQRELTGQGLFLVGKTGGATQEETEEDQQKDSRALTGSSATVHTSSNEARVQK